MDGYAVFTYLPSYCFEVKLSAYENLVTWNLIDLKVRNNLQEKV